MAGFSDTRKSTYILVSAFLSMTNKKERPFRWEQGRRPQEFEPQTYENITTSDEEAMKKVEEYGIVNLERMSKR